MEAVGVGLGTHKLTSGEYFFPSVNEGDIIVNVDKGEKVCMQGQMQGKGKVYIENAEIKLALLEGDLDVTFVSCWITEPFINKTSSLVLRNCTIALDLDKVKNVISNFGLKLALENSKIILVGEKSRHEEMCLLYNEGELLTVNKLSCFVHAGHNFCPASLTYLKSNKGHTEVYESGLCLTSLFIQKPTIIAGEKCTVKMGKFAVFAEQGCLPTLANECSISFSSCFCNGERMEELAEKQEIIGDYTSHMNGIVHNVYAKLVSVNTEKAPVKLQLPLQARHNTIITITRESRSAFPVKIVTFTAANWILGQGSSQPCQIVLRFSSRGWVEKRAGVKTETMQSKSLQKKSTEEQVDSLVKRSKQLRNKFNKGRQRRRELFD